MEEAWEALGVYIHFPQEHSSTLSEPYECSIVERVAHRPLPFEVVQHIDDSAVSPVPAPVLPG